MGNPYGFCNGLHVNKDLESSCSTVYEIQRKVDVSSWFKVHGSPFFKEYVDALSWYNDIVLFNPLQTDMYRIVSVEVTTNVTWVDGGGICTNCD